MSEVRLPGQVPATIITKDEFHDHDDLKPGTVAFNGDPPTGIWNTCPCGCGLRTMLPIQSGPGRGWSWDGDREKPTLGPSIRHNDGNGVHWHGWLSAGFWIQA